MKRMMMLSVFLLTLLAIPGTSFGQGSQPLLMRYPTMSKTSIVFSYAGDLWIVPRQGGEAKRLTNGVGTETLPYFSPDGKWIAFAGEYDGNLDVYVAPATGGVPKRLTSHPAQDFAVGWTPDGKVLFASNRNSVSGSTGQLFTMPVDGAFPTLLPLPTAYGGSYSPDGTHLAYSPLTRPFTTWKRYRGGQASQIWIANLSDSSIERIPRNDSNDFNPMWIGNTIYFVSDRNGPFTLFSYDRATQKVTQLIQNHGLDIKWASGGPDAIVYEQFGSINLYDLKTGKTHKVDITINADMPAVRSHFVKVGSRATAGGLSPNGARAVFEAHGEILTVPAEKGDVRNLTNTTGIAERTPAWSPDGKWIAYFSDESGEYQLHLRNQTGGGEVKKISLGMPASFYYSPVWSPDSKKLAYTDKHLNLWYVDIDKGEPVKVDTAKVFNSFGANWSPDSRWLAYAKPLESLYHAVYVYSLDDGKTHQITDGMSDATSAQFDKNGKYIYFSASTDIGPGIFDLDMSSYSLHPTRNVYVCILRKDLPSPLANESDEEKVQVDRTAANQAADKAPEGPAGQKPPNLRKDGPAMPSVTIDFDRIARRIVSLPIPARNYVGLQAGKANSVYILEASQNGGPLVSLGKFDLDKRRFDKVVDGIQDFYLSANGDKMLYHQGPGWFITATAQPPKPGEGRIKTEDMEVYVDPRAEWDQMYREVWRIERDYFYDPNYHGLDLKEAEQRYRPYLAGLADRGDLNYLFQEMLSELTIGHLSVGGGELPTPLRVAGGLLGADYKIENGRYRFTRIYDGENWNPDVRAPLAQPGVNVVEGEYLLSVNGRNLTSTDDVYSFFEETADKQVIIRVGPNPDDADSREVTVVPVSSEQSLRYLTWIEDNRRKVDELSGGKLAYVHLPDTRQGGYGNFNRYFFSQLDKQGAVIDERFNGGGKIADYIIDYLRKPIANYWTSRDGADRTEPSGAMAGPKTMIINEFDFSGGDWMPWMFRHAQIGPLIGKRTTGGLVAGQLPSPPLLIDGGSVTAPSTGFYSPDGKWEIENHGVDPDIEVEMDPKAWREGRDPQLEKAVEVELEALKRNPPRVIKRPEFPNYHKASANPQ